MNILITGGNGFIARNIINKLNISNNIYALVRSESYIENVTQGVKYIKVNNYCNLEEQVEIFSTIDIIIHAASSKKKYSKYNPNTDFNYLSTLELLKISLKTNVKKFIFLSSTKVYGDRSYHNVLINEESKTNPRCDYSLSKLNTENLIIKYCEKTLLQYYIIRCPAVYGMYHNGNFKLFLRLIKLGIPLPFKNINNKRSFLSANNLVNFLQKIMIDSNNYNQIYLISDNEDISTTELIKLLITHSNKKVFLFYLPKTIIKIFTKLFNCSELYFSIFTSFQLDISKSYRKLNWQRAESLEKGVKEFVIYENNN